MSTQHFRLVRNQMEAIWDNLVVSLSSEKQRQQTKMMTPRLKSETTTVLTT